MINVCLKGGRDLGLEDDGANEPSAKAALQDAFYEKVILELETGYKEVK